MLSVATETEQKEVEHKFTLDLNGDLKPRRTVDNFILVLTPRIKLFADNLQVEYQIFALSFIRIYFTGTPKRFENIDNMLRSLNYYIDKFLTRYDLNLKIKYKEIHKNGR